MFNIEDFKVKSVNNNRYSRRIASLEKAGKYTRSIEDSVKGALENIESGVRSFVIYGEPQSGKTELMIALTAKLLDKNFRIILILLNDSVQLLDQNLERFQRSGLDPSPKKFSEVLDNSVKIGENSWVIFSKKNSKDLQKLLSKFDAFEKKVIIDDEADFATPNGKVNKKEKTKINALTGKLIGETGIYIGVTATPARLDLNNTHSNQNDKWIDFLPHPLYQGKDIFFPTPVSNLKFRLTLLPDEGDDPKYIREALFSFMINVAHVNTQVNDTEQNYSILIHTSGKKVDHTEDYKQIIKIFDSLRDETDAHFAKFYKRIWDLASERYPGEEDSIVSYIIERKNRNNIVVMNSDKEKNVADNKTATSPSTLFTIIIGGNIVSRGVTFDNLLSMFFTRDVKHKFQQDTYIQRARMFGSRGKSLGFFELSIPEELYLNWHKCFIFHRLSLEARRSGNGSPVWLEDNKVKAASGSSIDKTTVEMHSGEMSFEKFDYAQYGQDVENIIDSSDLRRTKLEKVANVLGNKCLPKYLLDYIDNFSPSGDNSIAIHPSISVANRKDMDQQDISRSKGFIGTGELELPKYPDAIHHFKIFINNQNMARVFYKYKGNIKFIKNHKSTQ